MAIDRDVSGSYRLAINGGARAVTAELPPMYPGGMRIGAEEEAAVLEVLRSKRLFRYYGPRSGRSKVSEFEAEVSAKFAVDHALAVSSGGMALTAALAAVGVGPDDEVIIPAYTWIATAAAVLMVGAVPVIAEVDESLTLDAADVERRLTARTKAILPVHMRGGPSDMGALGELATRKGLKIVEDVAQAFGASYQGERLGSLGDVGAFSLQFNKIITAGEGGLLVTKDSALFERALMYHDVGASQRSELASGETFVGTTCRMSELQGAVAGAQLGKLDRILADMRRNHATIKGAVSDIAEEKSVRWRRQNDTGGDAGLALVAFVADPAQAVAASEALVAEGADASVLYRPDQPDYHVAAHWRPLIAGRSWSHVTPWASRDDAGIEPDSCPRTIDLLGRAVHLNVSPDLSDDQTEQIAFALRKVFLSMP